MGMAKSPQKSSAAENTTYQLHIALEDIDPLIWRRLWVPSNLSLVKLDRVIQAAMGWTNSHLHEFEIAGERYAHINDDWDQDERLLDERRRTMGALLAQDVPAFSYLYDFGDNWRHIVVVEKVIRSDEGNNWTQCIAGANACPPEDVGGTGGYEEFVEAISNPRHEEHIAMRRWNGGPFDPRGFDVNAVNRELRRLRL
jgi:hypothetical protein